MSVMEEQLTDKEISSLLKVDNRGWDIKLFEDETKICTCICANCKGICCDAVELGCDHEDDDIFLYCNICLNDMIRNNDNKCPVDNHENADISSNRSIRKQISKAMVICPYSMTYKSKGVQMDNNADIVDTMGGGDEKEGNEGQNIAVYQQQVYGNEQPLMQMNNNGNDNGCNWKGTLNELINEHLIECTKSNNPVFMLNKRMEELENQCTAQKLQIETLTKEVILLGSRNSNLETEKRELLTQLEQHKIEKQSLLMKKPITSEDVDEEDIKSEESKKPEKVTAGQHVNTEQNIADTTREYLHLTASVVNMKFPRIQHISSEELINKVKNYQFWEYHDMMVRIMKTEEQKMMMKEKMEREAKLSQEKERNIQQQTGMIGRFRNFFGTDPKTPTHQKPTRKSAMSIPTRPPKQSSPSKNIKSKASTIDKPAPSIVALKDPNQPL